MIRFDNVSINLNGFSLRQVNFHVPTGTYAVLMGRTGCGKTTILEATCGLRPIAQGRVYLMDRDMTRTAPGRRNLGFVPQDAALFTNMTVADHLGFALRVRKQPRRDINTRVEELAAWLNISHLLHRRPLGLSGGERQRVAIGRALAARPSVLCLDEPFAALDEETHADMTQLLRRVHQETGVTVLHITHNRREAKLLAQQLLVMKSGTVLHGEEAKACMTELNDDL